MDKETALDKIRKCLNLSQSSNSNEAAAAMRQAQKLMKQFGISDDEATAPEIGVLRVQPLTKTGRGWEGTMVTIIGNILGLRTLQSQKWDKSATFLYIGPKGRVELAEYAHMNLRRAIEKQRKEYVNKLWAQNPFMGAGAQRTAGTSFAVGFASEVGKAVSKLIETPAEKLAIENFMAKEFGAVVARRSSMKLSGGAYHAGREAGASYSMHRPMGGVNTAVGAIE